MWDARLWTHETVTIVPSPWSALTVTCGMGSGTSGSHPEPRRSRRPMAEMSPPGSLRVRSRCNAVRGARGGRRGMEVRQRVNRIGLGIGIFGIRVEYEHPSARLHFIDQVALDRGAIGWFCVPGSVQSNCTSLFGVRVGGRILRGRSGAECPWVPAARRWTPTWRGAPRQRRSRPRHRRRGSRPAGDSRGERKAIAIRRFLSA